MTSAEFFNELISMALKAELNGMLTPRNNIIAFLNIAECELGHKLSLEFKHRYDEGYDVGHKDGHKVGCQEGYSEGFDDGHKYGIKAGYNKGYDDGLTAANCSR